MSIPNSPLLQAIQKKLGSLGIDTSSRLLIGVSGGMDSMVLLTILTEMKYRIVVGHVNFQLRGRESDEDAFLVRTWCSEHNVQFLEFVADTELYKASHKVNTQSAAREMRYNWWKDLVENGSFDWVVTAHHQDDSIETLFLNLLRGTGIKGLIGIPEKRGYFIRPMIDISRNEIETFAFEHHIPFRTDRSNDSDDYQRNRIRHHLIPVLQELNPDFHAVMTREKKRIELEWDAWNFAYQHWQRNNLTPETGGIKIKVHTTEHVFLLRWLEEKNIPWSLGYDFISSLLADSAKSLIYDQYQLSRTKDGYYFEHIEVFETVIIKSPGTFQIGEQVLSIELVPFSEFSIVYDPAIEFADLNEVSWPLELSAVTPGDHFQPIGMQGKSKKIQDYLVDIKLDQHEKNKVRILKSKEHIVWLVGMRLDERVKVNPGTTEIFRLRYHSVKDDL